MSKQSKNLFNTKDRFGIRKLTIGTASLLLGTVCYIGINSNEAQAAEEPQIEQSNGQATNEATNDVTNKLTNESTNESMNKSTDESTNESTDETLVNNSVNNSENTSEESTKSTKTNESNINTEESTNHTNTDSTNTQAEKETNDTNVTTHKENLVDNKEQDINTLKKNTIEKETTNDRSLSEQPSTENTENNTTKETKVDNNNNNSELDQLLDNYTEKDKSNEQSASDESSKEEKTENNEVKSKEQPSIESSKEETMENKENSTNINKEEVAPKEDKSTLQSETKENSTKEESKSEEVETSSDNSNKEDNKTINDVETNSNEISNNTNEPVKPSVDVENNTDTPVRPEADSEISNASELNSITSPFVSLNALETAGGSQPTNNPTDVANSVLSQPVIVNRSSEEESLVLNASEIVNNNTIKNAEYFEDPSLLTSDKYEILELTSENVKGKDKYTKDTFNTHMVIKLDNSVKPGDKLVYGVGYDYTDLNGDIHKVYLPSSNDYIPHTTPIIYQNVEIGTMTVNPPSYEVNELPPRYFSLDEVNGVDKITTIIPTFNGEELTDQAKSSTEHIKVPTNQVIKRGTGIEDIRTETKTEPLKYGTDKVFDQDLPEGYKEVIRKGENGEITTTIKTPTLNGKDNGPSDESRVISKQPVNEIVKIGTGKLTTKTSQNAESQPFKIIYKEDPTLPKGETKIERKGQNGLIVVTIEQDYVNGKKYGEPKITTTTNKEKIDQIVLIGTKEPVDQIKPNDPTNNKYEPKGGHINKNYGEKTDDKEITNKVSIPKYNGEKPLITIDNPKQIPDGQTSGDYSVSITVKYPDGSTDHTIVTIHIGDKPNINKSNDNKPNDNKPNDNKPNDNKPNDNKHDVKPNTPSNDQPSHQTNHKKDLNNNKFNNKSSQNITHIINNQVKKSESSNMESIVSNVKHQEEIKENVINELKHKYNISQKEVMQNHEKEVNHITQDRITKDQSINELPQTGESSKAGLWASMLALLGGMTLLTRRKNKKKKINN